MSDREGFCKGWDAAVQLLFKVSVNPKLTDARETEARALGYLAEEMFRIRDDVADSAFKNVA
jgi:hypothetical protein